MQIPSYNSHEWNHLYRILERKDGAIYKTEPTGFHIHGSEPIPDGYVPSAISTKLTKEEFVFIRPLYRGRRFRIEGQENGESFEFKGTENQWYLQRNLEPTDIEPLSQLTWKELFDFVHDFDGLLEESSLDGTSIKVTYFLEDQNERLS